MIKTVFFRLFTDPEEAFRELADAAPSTMVIAFYTAVLLAQHMLDPQAAAKTMASLVLFIPKIEDPKALAAAGALFALAVDTLWALLAHAATRLVGGTSSFHRFWTVMLFVGAVTTILEGALTQVPKGVWAVFAWSALLSVAAIRAVHEVSRGQAIVSFIAAWGAFMVITVSASALAWVPMARKSVAARHQNHASTATKAEVALSAPAEYGWTVRALDGSVRSMGEARGKTVLLNFWATWCGPCISEMPSLQKLYDRFKDDDRVAFYLVSDESPEAVNSFLQGKGYTMPFYTAQSRPAVFRGMGIPLTFLLSPDGRILKKQEGAADWDSDGIVDLITSARNGTLPPAPPMTPPKGPGGFLMSSVGGGFAAQGVFEGRYRAEPSVLQIVFSTATIQIKPDTPYQGERLITVVRVGLREDLGGGKWNATHKTVAYTVDKTLSPGMSLVLGGATVGIPVESAKAAGRPLVVEIETVTTMENGRQSTGWSYVHGPAVE